MFVCGNIPKIQIEQTDTTVHLTFQICTRAKAIILVFTSEDIRHTSGGLRATRLPGQVTHAVRAVSLWVEKIPVPPPNCRALDWSVVLTVRQLCPIVPQDNIVVSNKHN